MSLELFEEKLLNVKFLVEHSRLLEAQKEANLLYDMSTSLPAAASEILEAHKELLITVKNRARELENIMDMCSSEHSGWTLGSEMFGISTYYKIENDGQLSVRMEGIQDIPIFEQIIVFYECALYNEWIPFCKRSELLKKISKRKMFLSFIR